MNRRDEENKKNHKNHEDSQHLFWAVESNKKRKNSVERMQENAEKRIEQQLHIHHQKKNNIYQEKQQNHPAKQEPKKRVSSNAVKEDEKNEAGYRNKVIYGTMALFFIFALYLAKALFSIQIMQHDELTAKANELHFQKIQTPPVRGSIYDRNGVLLAGTTYVYTIGMTPKHIESIGKKIKKDEIVKKIAAILEIDEPSLQADAEKVKESYILIKKDVTKDVIEILQEFLEENRVGGIKIDAEARRYYTNDQLASHILGFTSNEAGNLEGKTGIELLYNNLLMGKPGYSYGERDNFGSTYGILPFAKTQTVNEMNGKNIHLTIDRKIQEMVQKELENVLIANQIEDGVIIIMEPKSGDILALGNAPNFSCSNPTAKPKNVEKEDWDDTQQETIDYLNEKVWRNNAISDAYEPGSTFKALTTGIAFDENTTNESDTYSDAPLVMGEWSIRCHVPEGHGQETLEQAFWRSCNPVFAQIALNLGIKKYSSYMQSFGFNSITGIDLPGEAKGIMHDNPQQIDIATLSFGESSTATPLQLINAFNVIGNGGNLVKPQIIRSIQDSEGAMMNEMKTTIIRKVLSEQSSSRVRKLMEGVVLHGTGTAAYREGYAIGGKTGTSTDEVKKQHTLVFAGMAPIENPELVCLVLLDNPADYNLSSSTAASLGGEVIAKSLDILGFKRNYTSDDRVKLETLYDIPNLKGKTYADAIIEANRAGFKVIAGSGDMSKETIVQAQSPENEILHKNSNIYLYADPEAAEIEVAVPNFIGKNIQECLQYAAEARVNVKAKGELFGLVYQQSVTSELEESTEESQENIENMGKKRKVKQGSIIEVDFAKIEEQYEAQQIDSGEEIENN